MKQHFLLLEKKSWMKKSDKAKKKVPSEWFTLGTWTEELFKGRMQGYLTKKSREGYVNHSRLFIIRF